MSQKEKVVYVGNFIGILFIGIRDHVWPDGCIHDALSMIDYRTGKPIGKVVCVTQNFQEVAKNISLKTWMAR